MKVAALRTAPPTMIAIVVIVCIYKVYTLVGSACVRVHSHIGWKYLLILQVFLQGDAASHNGCELDVVHNICTGIFGMVFFDDFATNPSNPSNKSSDGCGVEERFDELVVRHGGVYLGFIFQDSFGSESSSYSSSSPSVCAAPSTRSLMFGTAHSADDFAMTQTVSAARQLNRQSAFAAIMFALTTTAANPPAAIPIRAPFIATSMAWGIYRVSKCLLHLPYATFYRNARWGRRGLFGCWRGLCGCWWCGPESVPYCLALVVHTQSGDNQSSNPKNSHERVAG